MRFGPAPWTIALVGLGGCFGDRDVRIPGDPLGRYAVEARLVENSCGDGAFGAADSQRFELRLSRDGDELYWLSSSDAPLGGSLDAEGDFSIDSESRQVFAEPTRTTPGCAMLRRDRATGRLGAGDPPSTLSLTLAYAWTAEAGSACSNFLGLTGGPVRLPCAQRYTASATRLGD